MAGKKLPRGITYSEKEKRYTGRFMMDGERYAVHGSTLKEAVDKMDNMKYEVKHGIYCKPQEETISSWFQIWIDQYKLQTVKQSTLGLYKQSFNNYIMPVIGKKKIQNIESQVIQKLINDMHKKGYSAGIVNGVYIILNGMFKQARRNQIIINNPMEAVVIPKFIKKQQKDKRVLTREEQNIFLAYSKESKYYDLYVVALQTGARIDEILGLRWEDIDLQQKVIHINCTLSYSSEGRGRYRDIPKSETSRRDIPILPDIEKIFKNRRKQQMEDKMLLGERWKEEKGLENSVFTNNKGSVIWDSSVRRDMYSIVDAINCAGIKLKPIKFHTFRHTFATRAMEQGMPLQVLKTILGHSTLAMTADLYSHVLPDTKREEMQKIIELF